MAIRQANSVNEVPATQVEQEQRAAATGDESVVSTVEKAETSAAVAESAAVAAETAPVAQASAPAEDRSAASASVLDEEEEEPAAQAAAQAAPAATSESTAVSAPAAGNAGLPVHKNSLMSQITAQLAEEGFEGVELDYSSFLNITLNKQIETSEGQELPNSGFEVRVAGSRLKYCFRNNNPVEDEVEVAYSYDKDADKDPNSNVAESIKKWKEEGLALADVKVYTEVLAIMIDDKVDGDAAGELNGKLVTLQIAPTSKGRWAGYLAQLKLQGKDISNVRTLARRGKKIESGKFPFYPWDFVCKGDLPAA